MSILIKGMEMPKTGRYFVAVDNTDGKDKTVIAIMSEFERGDKTRPLLAVHEIVPIPDHGDLIERDTLPWYLKDVTEILEAPTIIPADKEGET